MLTTDQPNQPPVPPPGPTKEQVEIFFHHLTATKFHQGVALMEAMNGPEGVRGNEVLPRALALIALSMISLDDTAGQLLPEPEGGQPETPPVG
jgi:hypothetical protein